MRRSQVTTPSVDGADQISFFAEATQHAHLNGGQEDIFTNTTYNLYFGDSITLTWKEGPWVQYSLVDFWSLCSKK